MVWTQGGHVYKWRAHREHIPLLPRLQCSAPHQALFCRPTRSQEQLFRESVTSSRKWTEKATLCVKHFLWFFGSQPVMSMQKTLISGRSIAPTSCTRLSRKSLIAKQTHLMISAYEYNMDPERNWKQLLLKVWKKLPHQLLALFWVCTFKIQGWALLIQNCF